MMPEQLISAATHMERKKFEAREILNATDRSRLPLWAVFIIYGCGLLVFVASTIARQPILGSLVLGLSVFSSIFCYRLRSEVSRINKRLDALLLLQLQTGESSLGKIVGTGTEDEI